MSTDTLAAQRRAAAGQLWLCMFLLWLAGNGLRLTILAPPPVISLVHADLNMTETEVGLLSGIPALLFAFAAVPGALLVARFGARNTLLFGLIATAVGSALRGASPNVATLFLATGVTGFGVAVMQPTMPALVRAWLPKHVSVATAVYTNGLLIGEVLPVALTLPLVMPLVGSWRIDFAVWGAACVVIAVIVAALAPGAQAPVPGAQPAAPRRWWPDWHNSLLWRLGIMMGCVNATYFATNFFVPRYLHVTGRDEFTSAALIALNVGQLPASALLLFFGRGLEVRNWPYVAAGLVCLASVAAIVFGNGPMVVAGAGMVGFSAAAVLILMLALPPILSEPDDVARSAAGMMAISYTCAVVAPILCGFAWDASGLPAMAFLPLAVCCVVLFFASLTARIRPFSEVGR
ncbi:MAG TPA: MFS transporter [Burkholderiales bacterium]